MNIALRGDVGNAAIDLTLMPGATVEGRVDAEGAEPPEGVRVLLLLHQTLNGRLAWQTLSSQETDGEGRFHFSGLRPGEYTLGTAVWPGEGPLPRERDAVTEQYPAVLLGGADDLASAVRLRLRFGQEARAELHLQPAAFFPIVIPVNTGDSRGSVNARLAGGTALDPAALHYVQRDGAIEGALPDGRYHVLLSGYGPTNTAAELAVQVSGRPVRTAPVTLVPLPSLAVQVQFDLVTGASGNSGQANGATARPSFHLILEPEDRAAGNVSASSRPAENGASTAEFELNNVQPGRYQVVANADSGYVAALRCGGVDLLRDLLTVGLDGVRDPILAQVRNDTGSLSGTVTGNPGGPEHVFVVALPAEGAGTLSLTPVGQDGSFKLPDLAPGSYRVLAGTGLPWQIAYKEPGFWTALEGKGSVVTVGAGARQTAVIPFTGDFDALLP